MPIYEFNCDDCHEIVNIFFRSFADVETKEAACPHCQGTNLERVLSQVTVVHSGKSDQGGSQTTVNSTSQGRSHQEDSQSLAQTMRRASQKGGQDFGGEFNEVARRLERGEKSSSIEKSLRKRAGQDGQVH